MASVALIDRAPVLMAVEGTRIPRRAWSCMAELAQLLTDAGEIVRAAELQAEDIRQKAHAEGFAAGMARAQQEMTERVLEAERAARELNAASEQRVYVTPAAEEP